MGIVKPSYLSKFIDSVCYCFERAGAPHDRSLLSNSIAQGALESKLDLVHRLHKFASHYLQQCEKKGGIAHGCHAISDGFMRTLGNIIAEPLPIAITIGDIWVRGKKKYNVTRPKIDKLIRTGFDKSRFIDAHVWLTLSDMTVIDLTLLYTLRDDGDLDLDDTTEGGILVWREGEPSDYIFEPLLVDNDFFQRLSVAYTKLTKHPRPFIGR